MLCAVVCWLFCILVIDGVVSDGLIFGLAEASFGAKLNGVGVGAVPTEGMALNNVSPSKTFVPLLKFVYKHLNSFLWPLC